MAGIFYPEEPEALNAELRNLLGTADPAPCPPAPRMAIVSPHGAFTHSGTIQALAWKSVAGARARRVVILGPQHAAERKGLILPESGYFETPLGDIEVDRASAEAIADSCSDVEINDIPHLGEHSIEMQLPFMRMLFPEARLVPVLIARPDSGAVRALSRALDAALAGQPGDTLFVVSSNMCMEANAETVRTKTREFVAAMSAGPAVFERACLARDAPCGAAGIASLAESSLFSGWRADALGVGDSESAREHAEEPIVGYAALRLVAGREP